MRMLLCLAALVHFTAAIAQPVQYPSKPLPVIPDTVPNAIPTVQATGPFRCIAVIDGDTLVLTGGQKVRLIGVDTPETVDPRKPVQVFGKEASAFTKRMATGKDLRLEYDHERTDKYGRTLAYVYLPDGKMLNGEIIKQGYGFAYTKYPFKYMELFRQCERHARNTQVGLWSPTVQAQIPNAAAVETLESPAATPMPALNLKPAMSAPLSLSPQAAAATAEQVYVTPAGKKYHRDSCTYMGKNVRPMTLSQAKGMGLTPCSRCRP